MGFIEFGTYSLGNDYVKDQKDLTAKNVYRKLDSIVRTVGNNKVILVPMFNTGDTSMGYQVLKRIEPGSVGYVKGAAYTYLPKSGYIKLDTSDPNYKSLLDYSIRLMQSGKCAFVMKKWQDNIGDLGDYLTDEINFIMAFNRERILEPDEIFSPNTADWFAKGYENYNVKVGSYSTSLRPIHDVWRRAWLSDFPLTVKELMSYLSILQNVKELKSLFLRL